PPRFPRRPPPTRCAVFAKTLLLRYAVSDIVFPSTALGFRQRDWGFRSSQISLLARHLPASCHPTSEESRGSQLASRRPLGESNLSDELRLHPVHAAMR